MHIFSQGFLFVVLGVSLSQQVQAAPKLLKTEHNISEYVLDNGFRVILAPNAQENKVYFNTIYLTGGLNDPQAKSGLAHLLEHLAFKGTQNIPAKAFQQRLDQYTLFNNASTSYYATQYTNLVRPETKAIQEMLLLEAERMDKLVLKPEFVPSEIEIVKREREMRLDQPFAVLMDQIWKAVYGNAFLGRPPIGDLNELKSIQMPELQRFYRTWYAPNNAVMVIAGKFDSTQVLNQIDQQFSGIAARALPMVVKVPPLNINALQQREFEVKKGSHFAKYFIYLQPYNAKQSAALDILPELFNLQPSGHLYQNLVESTKATTAQASTWIEPDFQVIFAGAVYAPNMDGQAIQQGLIDTLEQPQVFKQTELTRVQQLLNNAQDGFWANSSAVGAMLSRYVIAEQGNWGKYFQDHAAVMALKPEQVNTIYPQVLSPSQRLQAQILPTPSQTQSKADSSDSAMTTKVMTPEAQPQLNTPRTNTIPPEKPLNAQQYQKQLQAYLLQSSTRLKSTEAQIERGQLSNGLRYAIFPTNTRDDKSYATLNLQFGNADNLAGKTEALDIMAYLLLRGTAQYDLQAIADKSIAAGGGVSAAVDGNNLVIDVAAKTEHFAEYLQFVFNLIQHPNFSQSQFDLIRSQQLASLEQPYTEPQTVAGLSLARATEQYPSQDLRHHFEPEQAKIALQKLTRNDVVALYTQFIAAQHAQVAVTGNVDVKVIKDVLQQHLLHWQKNAPYRYIGDHYVAYPATQLHALAEPREFGFYIGMLNLPVGVDDRDAPALIVLSHILGNSQLSSRLAKSLREEQGLVYAFNSRLDLDSFSPVGAFSINANYSVGKAEQVHLAVQNVFKQLRDHGVTEQELAAAQADILKQRVTLLEDERNIHPMLISQLQRGKTLLQRQQRDQAIANLNQADIDRVIQQYLRPEHWVEVMADQYGKPLSNQALVPIRH